jgi:predicted DNA-binding transcriptional regulator AlpA
MNTINPGTGRKSVGDDGPLLPAGSVWARYGVVDRTLDRWLANESLGFPRPVVINKRRYFRESDLVEWERSRASAKSQVA